MDRNKSKANLVASYKRKLLKAISHLEYSFAKVERLTCELNKMDEETLETWESFTARFSRVVDLFLTKYLKAVVLSKDPGFEGSVRDFVDFGEKLGLVSSADQWMEFRGFRNVIVHEYEGDELAQNFKDMRQFTPQVIAIKDRL